MGSIWLSSRSVEITGHRDLKTRQLFFNQDLSLTGQYKLGQLCTEDLNVRRRLVLEIRSAALFCESLKDCDKMRHAFVDRVSRLLPPPAPILVGQIR
jgi:hypothetical protein